MRTDIHNFYLRLMQLQGWYAFAFLPVSALALPGALSEGRFLVVTTVLTLISGGAALRIALPGRRPRWLSHPAHVLHGLAGVLAWGVLALLFLAATLGTVILLGLPAAQATTLTLAATAAHVALCSIAALMAAGLGLSAQKSSPPAADAALTA